MQAWVSKRQTLLRCEGLKGCRQKRSEMLPDSVQFDEETEERPAVNDESDAPEESSTAQPLLAATEDLGGLLNSEVHAKSHYKSNIAQGQQCPVEEQKDAETEAKEAEAHQTNTDLSVITGHVRDLRGQINAVTC